MGAIGGARWKVRIINKVEDESWTLHGQHLKTWVTHRIPLLAVPTVSVVSRVVAMAI